MVLYGKIEQLLQWLSAPAEVLDKAAISYNISDIADLRSRDLRKILLKYGVGAGEISRVLDMRELQTWVVRLMEEERLSIISRMWKEKGLKAAVVVGIVTVLWYSTPFVLGLGTFIIEYFMGIAYQVRQQSEMAGVAYKKGMYIAGIMLTVAVLLDLLQRWMQASTVAGWVLPYESPLRRALFPFLSWSLTADMLVPKDVRSATASQQQQDQQGGGGGFGMNVAPMIYMGVTGYIKAKLQEKGTKPIADYVLRKAKRKEEKKEKVTQEQFEREAHEAQRQFDMDDEDVAGMMGGDKNEGEPQTEEYRQAFRKAVDASFRSRGARATYTAASAMDPAKQRMNDRYADSMREGDVSFLDQTGEDGAAASGWADSAPDNGSSIDDDEDIMRKY